MTLHSLLFKHRTLEAHRRSEATVDVLGMCLYASPYVIYFTLDRKEWCVTIVGVLYTYRRGLRSCLSIRWGKFDGQKSEISDVHESHAFLYVYT